MFYETLTKQAPTEKEKEIIRSIRDDEQKHNQILRKLYYEFTGQMLPPDNLIEEDSNNMELIMSIMTDELRHANKYDFF